MLTAREVIPLSRGQGGSAPLRVQGRALLRLFVGFDNIIRTAVMHIREAGREDLAPLLRLYTYLHDNPEPPLSASIEDLWDGILADNNHHVVVGVTDGELVSSCVCVIVPNLTRGQRPYALIENMVTRAEHRGKGYATRVLHFARDLAVARNCSKIMLMTGSNQESTLNFYEKAGYNRQAKTAFHQAL